MKNTVIKFSNNFFKISKAAAFSLKERTSTDDLRRTANRFPSLSHKTPSSKFAVQGVVSEQDSAHMKKNDYDDFLSPILDSMNKRKYGKNLKIQLEGERGSSTIFAGTHLDFHQKFQKTPANQDYGTAFRKVEEKSGPKVLDLNSGSRHLISPPLSVKSKLPLELIKRSDSIDNLLMDSTPLSRKAAGGNNMKDFDQALKVSQLKQLRDFEMNECKKILGEDQFASTIEYFRSQMDVS